MGLIISMQAARTIPEGEYLAELISVEQKEGKRGEYIKFLFQIVEPGYEMNVSGICSKLLTPKSKLFKWVTAFEPQITAETNEIDLESFIGKKVIVEVALQESNPDYVNVVNIKRIGRRVGPYGSNVDVSERIDEISKFSSTKTVENPSKIQSNTGFNRTGDIKSAQKKFIQDIDDLDSIDFNK